MKPPPRLKLPYSCGNCPIAPTVSGTFESMIFRLSRLVDFGGICYFPGGQHDPRNLGLRKRKGLFFNDHFKGLL